MCFRPAEVKQNICPKCGAANKPIAKVCAECGEPLEMVRTEIDPDGAKLGAPAAPAAPGAPKPPAAPGAPKPPSAPGAPKPPQA